MPADPLTVEPPPHPLYALATFELTSYRHQLERALVSTTQQDPSPAVRDDLQARLDAVLAEQDKRRKLADA
jgi:hypothetical protein